MKVFFTLTITALLSIVAVSHIKAQGKVTGMVLDNSNQPTAFATIALLSISDSSLAQGKITDENGTYEFKDIPEGEYCIRINYVGYKTAYSSPFSISSQNKLVNLEKIALEEASVALEEVTVTSQRPVVEKLSDKLVMNLDQSILTKGATAEEIVKIAPLVSTNNNGILTLRGKPNVMILIDGKTIPNVTLSTVLQNLPADEIIKLEIITNPSVKYDAAASGGVINIITKKGLQNGFNGSTYLYASQGLYERVYTGVGLNYRTNKVNIFGNVNYSGGKNFRNELYRRNFPTIGNSIENNALNYVSYQNPSAKIGLDYMINNNHTIGAGIDGYISTMGTDLRTESLFMSTLPSPDSILNTKGNSLSDYNVYNFNINYRGRLSEKGNDLSINATQTLYQQNSTQTLNYQAFSALNTPISGIQHMITETPSNVNIIIAQLDYTHPFTENISIETGVKYTDINSENNFTQKVLSENTWVNTSYRNSGYLEKVAAGYVNINTTFKKFNINAGIRGEQTHTRVLDALDRNFFNLFPSFSINRNIDDDYSLSFSYSRRIDRPLYENLIPIRVYVDPYSLREGNPFLKPQYSDVLEISNTFKNITLIAGYSKTKDAMIDIPIPDQETQKTTISYRNFSRIESYNLSIVLPFNITRWWQTNNSITGTYNDLSTILLNDIDFQTKIFSFTFNSTNTFSFKNSWKGELVGYYNSSEQYGIARLLPVYSIRIGLGKDILKNQGNLKIQLDDIFWSERFRGDAKVGIINQSFRNYYDTRRVKLAFTYKFGKATVKAAQNKSLGNETEKNRLKL